MWVADHPKSKLKDLTVLTRKDLMKGNKSVIPAVFFVHTYYSDSVEEHSAEPGYDFSRWDQWLNEGRIYIEKKKEINEDLLV